ncbi:hypothetical protein ACQPXB_19405 [Amycolatopsis sp. CA-161197]|uniref:hypothetical protein n=1 Tax=Amycolatopsis sp. CA-161197 TaxID=3239922 RepID=UPI003D942C83
MSTVETADPRAIRDAMLHAVPNRATDAAFDPHAEPREMLAPLGFTPEHSGGAITFLKRAPRLPSAIRIGRPTAVALTQQSALYQGVTENVTLSRLPSRSGAGVASTR